jgi:hypothetical protein
MTRKSPTKVLFPDGAQFKFDFGPDRVEYDMHFVMELPDGHALFRRKEGHGGYSYWTTHIAGICVYDEGLSEPLAVFYALDHLGVGEAMWNMIGASLGYKQK